MARRWVPLAICLIGLPVFLWGLDGSRHIGALPAGIEIRELHYPVRIEGATAGSPAHLRSLVERYTPGRTVQLRDRGVVHSLQIVAAFTPVHQAVSAVTALLFWVVACFVFAAWPEKDPGRAFFASTFFYGLAVAVGTESFPSGTHGLDLARPVLRTAALALTPAFFVVMSLLFPRRHPSVRGRRWVLPVLLLTAGAIAAWRSTVLLAYFANPTFERWGRVVGSERALGLFIAGLVALGFVIMFRSSRRAELTRERQQLKWVWWGIITGTSPYVFLYALPHALSGQPLVPLYLTRATALVVPVSLAVAAVRYQLLDIDIIIRRSLIYGGMAGVIAAIYLLVAETIGGQLARLVPGSARHVPLAAAFASVALYRPTRRLVGRWVDRTFFHIRHSHGRALARFRSAIARPRGQEELAAYTRRFVKRILALKSATVALRVRSRLVIAGEAGAWLVPGLFDGLERGPDAPGRLLAAPNATSLPEVEAEAYPPGLAEAGVPLVQPLTAFGRLHGLILAGEKVAERRYIEEDLKLIAGVASAAAEACERLDLAQRLAEERIDREQLDELNRMKSDFLSRVSHDLRTPVASIDWSARNLLDELAGPLNPSQTAYLHSVLSASIILGRLVANLLEISRLEQGDGVVALQPVDLASAVGEAADCLMPIASDRQLSVIRRVEDGLGPVRGQRDRLVQVVINLLQNAIWFSPQGGQVGLALERAEPGWQRLIVRDEGPGIAPGDEKIIFDRFRQGAVRPGEGAHGFGLGLHVVKGHVELFGGRVAAANRPEGGAEFVVSLMNWAETEGRST